MDPAAFGMAFEKVGLGRRYKSLADNEKKRAMSKNYDCIVLGVGGIGSAAMYYAASQGWRVLGLDRFPIGHARGSSHGQTRIIRQAYFEHPDYVPLLKSTYELWDDLEKITGQSLFQRTGLLQVGNPQSSIIQGVKASAEEHALTVREFDNATLQDNFPLFHFRDDDVGVLEENAGFLRVEECVSTFAQAALEMGAELVEGVTIEGWDQGAAGYEVTTSQGRFFGRRLIIAAGAWAHQLMPELDRELRVIAKHQHWFRIPDERTRLDKGCPIFFFETAEGYFYGFPDIDGNGTKICEHSGGTPVENALEINREIDPVDLERVQHFAHHSLNCPRGIHHDHRVCMYTMSPDEHFIVDRADDQVAFACGLSGHGFKFAPVLGKALVQLLEGSPRADMDFLKLKRFNDEP